VTVRLSLGLTPWRLDANLLAETLCSQAEQAEAWGFDSFFLPESHFNTKLSIPDPLLLLAAVAGRTRNLTLGTSSWLLPIREPLLAAEQVAVVDQLCSGRLVLGLGRGFQPGMLEAFGVRQQDKRERFEATLALMQTAWSGATVGDPAHPVTLAPLPTQTPHPPLWIAAFGPKAIAQAGRLGLPYFASPMETLAELETNFAAHREALIAAGAPVTNCIPIMRSVFISDDGKRCREIRRQMAQQPRPALPGAAHNRGADSCMVGCAAEVGEQIARHQERLGMNHMIAVRPRIRGIEEDCSRASLQALAQLRSDLPSL